MLILKILILRIVKCIHHNFMEPIFLVLTFMVIIKLFYAIIILYHYIIFKILGVNTGMFPKILMDQNVNEIISLKNYYHNFIALCKNNQNQKNIYLCNAIRATAIHIDINEKFQTCVNISPQDQYLAVGSIIDNEILIIDIKTKG